MKCLNCGHEFDTPYCGGCGQRASSGKLSMADVRQAVQSELHLSRGWLRTVVELTRRPGGMIRDYLDGHRVVYIGPVRYSLTIMAMTIFLTFSVLPPMFGVPVDADDAALQKAMLEASQRFGQFIGVLHAPIFALLAWAIFFRSGLGYAEHLTASLYCTGHLTLVSSPFLPIDSALETGGVVTSSVFYGVGVLYLALILRDLVARSWWTAGLASIAILLCGAAICCAGWVPIVVILAFRSVA